MPADKDPGALLTIGELSEQLGVAQHILRYWESRFPQLKPMQRAGNRRYYRPADVELVRRINRLLNHEGYTVRGVQKLLREKETASELLAVRFCGSHLYRAASERRYSRRMRSRSEWTCSA